MGITQTMAQSTQDGLKLAQYNGCLVYQAGKHFMKMSSEINQLLKEGHYSSSLMKNSSDGTLKSLIPCHKVELNGTSQKRLLYTYGAY